MSVVAVKAAGILDVWVNTEQIVRIAAPRPDRPGEWRVYFSDGWDCSVSEGDAGHIFEAMGVQAHS